MENREEQESSGVFQYTPLNAPSSEIRLVILQAGLTATADGDVPHCTLCHVSSNPWPAFIALSYTWGDAQDTLPILISGKRKLVTRNLADFLHHVAASMVRDDVASCVLWIDAISINQADDAEKSKQVQIMGDVYSKAASVMIWLGSATGDSHLAFQFLLQLYIFNDEINDRLNRMHGSDRSGVVYESLEGVCVYLL